MCLAIDSIKSMHPAVITIVATPLHNMMAHNVNYRLCSDLEPDLEVPGIEHKPDLDLIAYHLRMQQRPRKESHH